jgi:hypothetical protein
MGGNNLVHTMRFAARVILRTVDFVTKTRNCSPMDIMRGRAADYGPAMIGFIADRDYF